MKALKIEGTDDTPSILLDAETGTFELGGRSLPEDASSFYEPALEWLTEYARDPGPETCFQFKLSYFNTASSKMILDILMILEEMIEAGHKAYAKWYFPEDDEDMEEAGKEYAEMVDVPIEIILNKSDG